MFFVRFFLLNVTINYSKSKLKKFYKFGLPYPKKKWRDFLDNFIKFKLLISEDCTCTMCEGGMTQSDFCIIFLTFPDINLSFFTDKMWTMMAPGEFDPEFKAKMNEVYNTCYELSQSIPQSVLDKKGPMMKQFGRQKCFFKCVHVSTTQTPMNFYTKSE